MGAKRRRYANPDEPEPFYSIRRAILRMPVDRRAAAFAAFRECRSLTEEMRLPDADSKMLKARAEEALARTLRAIAEGSVRREDGGVA